MKRIICVIIFLSLLCSFSSVYAINVREEILDERVDVRYNALYYEAEYVRIGMDALITHVDSQGENSSKLVDLRDEFVALENDLPSARGAQDLDTFSVLYELGKGKVSEFREEARARTGNDSTAAVAAIRRARVGEVNYLDELHANVRESAKIRDLAIIDVLYEKSKEILDLVENRDVDTTDLLDTLDGIYARKSELEAAFDAANAACTGRVVIASCEEDEAESYVLLKEELKEEFRGFRESIRLELLKNRISFSINMSRQVLANVNRRIDSVKGANIDMGDLKSSIEGIMETLDLAEDELAAGNYEASYEYLKKAKEDFASMRMSASSPYTSSGGEE